MSHISDCSSISAHVSRTPLVDVATNTSVINKEDQHNSPSQEEKLGMALASHCLDALHDGGSMYSNVTSASVPESSCVSRETTTMHLDLRSFGTQILFFNVYMVTTCNLGFFKDVHVASKHFHLLFVAPSHLHPPTLPLSSPLFFFSLLF